MELEALLQVLDCLSLYQAQQIIIEILEKNLVVREWMVTYWRPQMMESGPGNKLYHTKYEKWIEECDVLYLHIIIRRLIIESGFIEESLKKKLLVEQEDGTSAIRKFELDTIKDHPSG
ncbi:uncharacterized protein EAF01_005644 [Botrytis porri]|uniref:uncharacterized protein n=1 Tax=Botrytis porri TaxID=87229 RepID=UPI0018FF5F2A|nr:uncharacterized protein EAF01_005644 [Botrytis porri]KAF7905123.1 hypothetical protein EAF01_005644 [Botrytis porri]